MEAIKEYLRSCHGVLRAPLVYVIRKNIVFKTYGDNLKYATPDDKMFARMSHLPLEKNKLLSECDVQSARVCAAEYKIDNRSVCDILDQIYKNTDLYPYAKHYESKRDVRGAFYAIHFRWLGPIHVNATASEAKLALQKSTYD